MKVKVRRANESELHIIQELNHELFESDGKRDKYLNHNWPYEDGEKYFVKRISKPDCICLVAEVDNQVVGYLAGALMETDNWRPVKRTELENMFVKEKFRGKGVGKKLVEEFLKWSEGKKVKKVMVSAYTTNEKAIKFYKREGLIPQSLSLEIEF
ncbi:hypothetical protein A2803_01555 [Candidatus Woesebacteria bacterium RIFCSPHIGHO2_01_FULL_44_21]|uniref:N-acetyltransferase domain-containing protein n=1 Tax=Candidatus Woesebacteria bacterium RIFCSPHIGHO2_01_FULL_44_21 TaxID=1802503 RepID=A0A1F7YV03_9BACT|nr:MAG: hypothetical protein A2803_01555 [Candidatus Woesebacteria bacterium RIFCSPHIGHO2_01_FULL_44_21]OGM69559.1 MAG: hypothetical protein A2897_03070 [Candidatus Woesebacteria bacterium RIFCSPLOWO2_01_FULL_44_24b]